MNQPFLRNLHDLYIYSNIKINIGMKHRKIYVIWNTMSRKVDKKVKEAEVKRCMFIAQTGKINFFT